MSEELSSQELRSLGEAIARAQDEQLARERVAERAFERFELATEVVTGAGRASGWRSRSAPRRLSFALIAAALGVLVAGFLLVRQGAAPVAWLARGENPTGSSKVGVGDSIRADQAQASVTFTDGTTVVLSPKSRGRLIALERAGGEVAVEDGRASVSVPPHQGRAWIVDAGPYRVFVIGTRFDVAWDESARRFDLVLYEGRVEVRGPNESSLFVVAGEHLSLEPSSVAFAPATSSSTASSASADSIPSAAQRDTRSATATAEEALIEPPATALPATAPPASLLPTASPPATSAGAGHPPRPTPNANGWRSLARKSRFEEAVKAAEAVGFDGVCASASAQDLLMLGDAARLAGREGRAQTAYASVRSRHAGSAEAARAAFALGVMAFPSESALPLLQEYLGQAPNGPLAPEALGRVLEIRHRFGTASEARATAKRYLASYPNGAHAKLARSILETP